jgi:hypothetical protein
MQREPQTDGYRATFSTGFQESRGKLEAEIRKLLHEVSRIAEQALVRARKVKEDGEPAVQAELNRLDRSEQEVTSLRESTPLLNAARV